MDKTGSDNMQLVVFKLGDEEFGTDINEVREIIRVGDITKMPNAPDFIEGMINLRGQLTTIVNLRKKMQIVDKAVDASSRIIIVQTEKNSVGMMVDSVTEVKYIKSEQTETLPQMLVTNLSAEYIKGICKLPNRLLILVDLKKVINDIDLGKVS
jgi:purine-binding chemotaxis protein CheW